MSIRLVVSSVLGFIVFCFLMLALFGWWYTIDQGERGVVLRNGAIVGTANPGLSFKIPWIDAVEHISVQSHNKQYEKLATYSRDQQPAEIRLSVNYRIPPDKVGEVYERFGSEDGLVTRLVDPRVFEHVKNVFGQFNAVTAIQERSRLNLEIQKALQASVAGPIMIESVQVENIDFSDAYENSVEQRMLAEVEVAKLRQNAEREKVQADIAVTQATGRANAVVAEAEARAKAIRLTGEAEAAAIQARGEALKSNPGLVLLTQAEKWNGVLPSTMLPNSTVPFMNMTAEAGR